MRRFLIASTALAALLPLGLALGSSASPSAAFGAGAVLETHRRLFSALDALDAAGVKQHLGSANRLGASCDAQGNWGDPPTFQLSLIGANGASSASDPAAAATALVDWARAGGGSTKIVSGWTDCYSKDLGFAVLEFERRGADGAHARRYQSTSFARNTEDGWKVYFWQIAAVPGDGSVAAR